MRLDLGPQIAVWIEGADGRFVDTVLVTNLTARLGIGNRPGHYLLPSSPKFPYGRRLMSLPVWAHRRGKLYDSVVMQDGTDKEYWLGLPRVGLLARSLLLPAHDLPGDRRRRHLLSHRPLQQRQGTLLRSGPRPWHPEHLENGQPKDYVPPAQTYYPPRNDLTTFTDLDCDGRRPCTISARSYAGINDLDAVAAATPPYGRPFSEVWRVPDAVPDGDYAVLVEVNKEFDENGSHSHPADRRSDAARVGADQQLRPALGGLPGALPARPARTWLRPRPPGSPATATGTAAPARLHPPDQTISEAPGSGVGRLLVIAQPALAGGAPLMGRVHVTTEPVTAGPPVDAAAPADAGGVGGRQRGAPADAGPSPTDGPGSPGACLPGGPGGAA